MIIDDVLCVIDKELNKISVPYEFMRWTKDEHDIYFVGEFTETEPMNEDGFRMFSFILTGTCLEGLFLELLELCSKIEDHFPAEGGFGTPTESGTVVIFYSGCFPVDTGEAGLKRIQVNLDVRCWKKGLK